MQVDHVEPCSDGGTDDLDNLLPACRSCNHYKGRNNLAAFRAMISIVPKHLQGYHTGFRHAVKHGVIIISQEPVVFHFEKEQ